MTGLFGLGGVAVTTEATQVAAAMLDRACITDPLTCSTVTGGVGGAGGWVGPAWQAEFPHVWIEPSNVPAVNAHTIVWLDGEIYDPGELPLEAVPDAPTVQQIATAYHRAGRHGDWSWLARIDGCFAVVIWDRDRQQIHLVSDRYGLRPLHWLIHRGGLVWSGNLKGLLAVPGFVPQINPAAVDDFLGMRYLMGDRTWFQGVERLSAATVLTWDLAHQTRQQQRYWTWDTIQPLPDTSDLVEVAREAGRRFRNSVQRQAQLPGNPLLTLSAGLDSRAIFAAFPQRDRHLVTLTFEKPGDNEAALPAQLTQKFGTCHQVILVQPENWVIRQGLATWNLEAVMPLNQLIFYFTLPDLLADGSRQVNFHGAGGDGVVGNTHFFAPGQQEYFLKRNLWLDQQARSLAHHDRVRTQFIAYCQTHCHNSFHQLYIDHRICRFSAKDFDLYRVYGIESRCPFLGNDFQELLYSLPLAWRSTPHYFYAWMLLETFPDYFRGWTPDLEPVASPNHPKARWQRLSQRVQGRLQRHIPSLKPRRNRSQPSTPSPLLQEPNASLCDRILRARSPHYAAYVDPAIVHQDWEAHRQGTGHPARVYDVLTLELWLRMLDQGGSWL